MKKIVFTGGGTAGHVIPNLPLMDELRKRGWDIRYIGSETGIEKQIIADAGVVFHAISSGKLRRYFSLQNLKDPVKVIRGVLQAYRLLKKWKPDLVFSKGGFVSVPVVFAAWLHKIPVIIHESDMTPGLANRLSIPFAAKVCTAFPETLSHLPARKAICTGIPIRPELLRGDADKGRVLCGFSTGKPILLVMGGSLGAQKINQALRSNLSPLLEKFQIVHICGKGHVDSQLAHLEGYRQFEYIDRELPDIFAMSDMVISRAGATAIFEFAVLRKPMLLIPLSLQASRGDQLRNAESFAKKGLCRMLPEDDLEGDRFVREAIAVYEQREQLEHRLANYEYQDSVQEIIRLIEAHV